MAGSCPTCHPHLHLAFQLLPLVERGAGCSETGRRWGGLGRGDRAGSLRDSGLTPAGRVPGVVLSTVQQPQREFTAGGGRGSPPEGASRQLRRVWPEAAGGSCVCPVSPCPVHALRLYSTCASFMQLQ